MTRVVAVILFIMSAALGGCAYTRIDRQPDGSFSYISTRDSAIDELHVTRLADGSLDLDLKGASGRASDVVEAQTSMLQAIVEGAIRAAINR